MQVAPVVGKGTQKATSDDSTNKGRRIPVQVVGVRSVWQLNAVVAYRPWQLRGKLAPGSETQIRRRTGTGAHREAAKAEVLHRLTWAVGGSSWVPRKSTSPGDKQVGGTRLRTAVLWGKSQRSLCATPVSARIVCTVHLELQLGSRPDHGGSIKTFGMMSENARNVGYMRVCVRWDIQKRKCGRRGREALGGVGAGERRGGLKSGERD